MRRKSVIFIFVMFHAFFGISLSHALIPIEGLILGKVNDIAQNDPLRWNFPKRDLKIEEKDLASRIQLEKYKSLFAQGIELDNFCKVSSDYRYLSINDKEVATRSVLATLQYIGLDITLKAISQYAKLLEIGSTKFENMVNNLVDNSCSANMTLYSRSLLKQNFKHYYSSQEEFKFPSIAESPYFSPRIKELAHSRTARKNEFAMTLKNFRALCSWGGNVENLRLLSPYVKNSFLMSYVFNHLRRKELRWNDEDKKILLSDSETTQQVACDHLVCRKVFWGRFLQLFPRRPGSTELKDDLFSLYCQDLRNRYSKVENQNKQIQKWIDERSEEDEVLEVSNLISLITGVPDLFITAHNFSDILDAMKESVVDRWNKWAKDKTTSFVGDLLYEESLHVDLQPQGYSKNVIQGDFEIVINYTLGELDRVFQDLDKVSATFELSFPKSYINWMTNTYHRFVNKSDYAGMEDIRKRLEVYISGQLEEKKNYFLFPLWNQHFSSMLAEELLNQLLAYRGSKFSSFSHEKYEVPVHLQFGLFALQYLHQKFTHQYRLLKSPK